jgi:hypothetical protein
MAEIVCIIGNKGGTGKTTLSHMLCQGMGLLGQRSVCVLTDTHREPLDPEGRRYLVADARTREALGKVVDKIRSLPGWLGVIDGGGNRTEMDRKLYGLASLVLLPFRDSHEDIRTVIRDLEIVPPRLGHSRAVADQSLAAGGRAENHPRASRQARRPHPAARQRPFGEQAAAAEKHSGQAAHAPRQCLSRPGLPDPGDAGNRLRAAHGGGRGRGCRGERRGSGHARRRSLRSGQHHGPGSALKRGQILPR